MEDSRRKKRVKDSPKSPLSNALLQVGKFTAAAAAVSMNEKFPGANCNL